MVIWRKSHRQWKSAVEEAISPARFASERDRLAARIAKQFWIANGGKPWADARTEGSLLLLETMILRHLDESVVRASLALEYLNLLEGAVRRSDYEDAANVRAEARWAERYLAESLLCALLAGADEPLSRTGAPARKIERLETSLRSMLATDLRASGLAA